MIGLGHAIVGSKRSCEGEGVLRRPAGSAGVTPLFEHPSGGRAYGKDGSLFFVVLGPYDGKAATVGNGWTVTFRFDTRAEVDALHAKALPLGGADEGAPGERAPRFYMSCFRDLDGDKLRAFNVGCP